MTKPIDRSAIEADFVAALASADGKDLATCRHIVLPYIKAHPWLTKSQEFVKWAIRNDALLLPHPF